MTSAWSNREPSDDTFIHEWMTFLQSDYARTCVHDYSSELDNLRSILCQDDNETNSVIESDVNVEEEREEWMILSTLANFTCDGESGMELTFDQNYWLDQTAQYSFEELFRIEKVD